MNHLPVLQSACCPPGPEPLDAAACEDYANRFKALADPTRVALIARLGHGEEVCVCHLVEGRACPSRRSATTSRSSAGRAS